jgi:tetratricopeptide (TPR) repeat protein
MTEIKLAAQRCRKAWKAAPQAKFAWCCHHAVELELLSQPAENRIAYILSDKPEKEQAVRLNNFRPVLSALPKAINKAWIDYEKARVNHNKAQDDYHKARVNYNKAQDDYHKAWIDYEKARINFNKARINFNKAQDGYENARYDYDKACVNFNKARSDSKSELSKLHALDVPGHTWNGRGIFPRVIV